MDGGILDLRQFAEIHKGEAKVEKDELALVIGLHVAVKGLVAALHENEQTRPVMSRAKTIALRVAARASHPSFPSAQAVDAEMVHEAIERIFRLPSE